MLAASFVVSCSKGGGRASSGKPDSRGELVPKESKKSFEAQRPYGMVAIPGGSFVMGQADADFTATPEKAPLKTVTVSSFFMDETESNQFRIQTLRKLCKGLYCKNIISRSCR